MANPYIGQHRIEALEAELAEARKQIAELTAPGQKTLDRWSAFRSRIDELGAQIAAKDAALRAHWDAAMTASDAVQRKLAEAEARAETAWRDALEAALDIVRTEEEFEGDPPDEWRAIVARIGPIENARSACRATKRSIERRISALAEKESK